MADVTYRRGFTYLAATTAAAAAGVTPDAVTSYDEAWPRNRSQRRQRSYIMIGGRRDAYSTPADLTRALQSVGRPAY